MTRRFSLLLVLLIVTLLVNACNINTPDLPTPTVEILQTDTPTAAVSPTHTPSPTPSRTPTQDVPTAEVPEIVVNTPAPRPTLGLPTQPPQTPATAEPWTYTVREGDTLGVIVNRQPWGYPLFDQGAMQAIVNLNPNVPNVDTLPAVGSEILIPRRTATPIPQGLELTETVDAQLGVDRFGSVVLAEGTTADCHFVEEGQTLVEIADIYNTTLEVLSQFNQNLNWQGCQFNEFSGGPNCAPLITEGQCVNVPLPTPTPIPTATLTGRETATPTPTYPAPRMFYPPDGALLPAGIFEVEWVSVGILDEDTFYLVEFEDRTAGTTWRSITRDNALAVPNDRIPTDGQPHVIAWRVTVVQRDGDGYVVIGGVGSWRTFQWQSR